MKIKRFNADIWYEYFFSQIQDLTSKFSNEFVGISFQGIFFSTCVLFDFFSDIKINEFFLLFLYFHKESDSEWKKLSSFEQMS